MTNILTWDEYSLTHDAVNQSEFPKMELRAEREIADLVGWIRFSEIDGSEFFIDQLKECIAKVIDADYEELNAPSSNVASVSNDGYSETYVTRKAEDIHAEKVANIKLWLSGTGLIGAYS